MIRWRNSLVFTLLLAALLPIAATAGDKKAMGGWEEGSPYNAYYDAAEMDSFKGRVVKVTTGSPMKGMSPGVILEIAESEDEKSIVHLCPVWFAAPDDIAVRKGDRVKVKGVWAEIDGQDIFMASKVKKGDYYEFKARLTKNGKPFWTMTPEEITREQASK